MASWRAVEDRKGDDEVDEPGAEVRLLDHEQRRQQHEGEDAHRRRAFRLPPWTVGDERGKEHDQRNLAELRCLKGNTAEADRPAGAINAAPERYHEQDRRDQGAIDRPFQHTQPPVVEARRGEHHDKAEAEIDRLTSRVLGRGAVDRNERAGAETGGGERQQRVEGEQSRAQRDGAIASVEGAGRGLECAYAHHREVELPRTTRSGSPNHFARIRRAAGAAASSPKPPCSTVTATTIGRFASGA
jgi:hypothetical protein